MKNYLNNQVGIVTGGTKGIGFAIAQELAQKGTNLVICSRSKVEAQNSALNLDKSRKKVFGIGTDISNQKQVSSLVKFTIKKFKRIDFLINAAGIFKPFGRFEEVPIEEHIKTIETNLIGSMRVCSGIIPVMKRQKKGRIILFSGGGVGGDMPLVNATSYFTSKGAVAIFTESLAEELKEFNININAILPGQILTDSTKATFDISDKILGPVLSAATRNLKKTGGSDVELPIKLIKFLLSKKADHITGRLLSARWDNIEKLSKKLPNNLYKLRRIEEKNYIKKLV